MYSSWSGRGRDGRGRRGGRRPGRSGRGEGEAKGFKDKRNKIGNSLACKIEFLENKLSKWSEDQIIHEFRGPNADNWSEIMGPSGIQSDMTGDLLTVVFKLLSHPNIMNNVLASKLYVPLNSPQSIMAMTMYFQMGPLSPSQVSEAVDSGRGSSLWMRSVEYALSVVGVFATVMRYFLDSRNMLPIETLELRVKTLLGDTFSEVHPIMATWISGIGANRKEECTSKALYLYEQLITVIDMQQNSIKVVQHTQRQKMEDEKAESDRAQFEKQRARRGIRFMDDPARDRDYLECNVVPHPEELLASAPSSLPQNLVLSIGRQGKQTGDNYIDNEIECSEEESPQNSTNDSPPTSMRFRNTDHYLNTHFQLNREDCLAQLRRGIASLRGQLNMIEGVVQNPPSPQMLEKIARNTLHMGGNTSLCVYSDVTVEKVVQLNCRIGYSVSFTVLGKNKSIDWSRSSRFMNGSLLCLSSDGTFNVDTIVVATVLRGVQLRNNIPMVTITIDARSEKCFNPLQSYVMVESKVFFEAYYPVLIALQKHGIDAMLPFKTILLGQSQLIGPPSYLRASNSNSKSQLSRSPPIDTRGWDMSACFPDFNESYGTKYWNPLSTPCLPLLDGDDISLDDSQRRAIELALSKRVSLIQGPPGTGKTFVGVVISRILLSNRKIRAPKPVVYICGTNHALDQMLELIYQFEPSIIRIGGRSESTLMQGLSLRNASNSRCHKRDSDEYDALTRMRFSLLALQASVLQRGLLSKDCTSLYSFPNSSLGRLKTILESTGNGRGGVIDELVIGCPYEVQKNAWTICSAVVMEKTDEKSKNFLPDWVSDFSAWLNLSVDERLLYMATYTPQDRAPVELQIIDSWRQRNANVKRKKNRATEEWQTVGDIRAEDACVDESAVTIDESVERKPLFESDGIEETEISSRILDEDWDDYFVLDTSQNGMTSDEAKVRIIQQRPVLIPISLDNIGPTSGIYKISRESREKIAKYWAGLLDKDGGSDIMRFTKMFRDAADVELKFKAVHDAEVLKNAAVIGLTANGAAKHNSLLRALGAEVIIVEEAAEVLEASVIASLTPSTKHLILIGDHLQLRPQVSEFNIGRYNGLDVSLFERLIRLGVPHVTLTTQRRMHPDISALITPSIYSNLINDPSVSLYPPVSGVQHRLFFLNHKVPEDGELSKSCSSIKGAAAYHPSRLDISASKSNYHEAAYLIRLVYFLLLNGYRASNIVVLTMYKGQLMLLRRLANEMSSRVSSSFLKETPEKVRMTTTDNYQGEESDIVLLSLVRSNAQMTSGFVKVHNRVCVALSRARHGMYVMGDFDMFCESSDLWSTICRLMKSKNLFGKSLQLQCPNHADAPLVEASCADDFDKCPYGGCTQPCSTKLTCGHICPLLCHPIPHNDIRCCQPCRKPRPDNCTHLCRKSCWEDCGPCPVIMEKLRTSCGHTVKVSCGTDVDSASYGCPAKCGFKQPCGHACNAACSRTGHDSVEHKCKQPCARTRPTCSHQCPKKCYERCGDCLVPVRKALPCGHEVTLKCFEDVLSVECTEICSKVLKCGHQCTLRCGLPCNEYCEVLVKKTIPYCKFSPRHFKEVFCSEDISGMLCSEACGELLYCGHACGGSCSDCNCNGMVDSTRHPPCTKNCSRSLLCNHKCRGMHICGDNSACPPCSKPCTYSCSHGPCSRLCGEECDTCLEPCSYSCEHFKCVAKCHEEHKLIPRNNEDEHISSELVRLCEYPCSKTLPCGHACMGICGERCPRLCEKCKPEDVEKSLSLFSKPYASLLHLPTGLIPCRRFIELRCGHAFDISLLDCLRAKSADAIGNETIRIPSCPECGETILGTYRYDVCVRIALRTMQRTFFARQMEHRLGAVVADISAGRSGAAVECLQAMLVAQARQSEYCSYLTNIYLLLGQANISLGKLREATLWLSRCHEYCDNADSVRRDALISTALCYLGGSDDLVSVNLSPLQDLNKAVDLLDAASRLDSAPSLKSFYHFDPEKLNELLDSVARARYVKKKMAEANERRRKVTTETYQAVSEKVTENKMRNSVLSEYSNGTTLSESAAPVKVPSTGGSALHLAACRGDLMTVMGLLKSGADINERDDLGNTPLLSASENGAVDVIRFLFPLSCWHIVNKAHKSFLDIVLRDPIRSTLEQCADDIENAATNALTDKSCDPSHSWAAAKFFDAASCPPLDQLMNMTGLRRVKDLALDLFQSLRRDMERPVESRVSSRQSMNFIFYGNPGTGKTTAARIFGQILSAVGLRVADKFVETSGQKLLQDGSSKFSTLLKNSTPGILFIDEVYQLDPKNNQEGRAITNAIMEATENDRDKLTVIVAGYRDDVREKWVYSNSGISSRFPMEITFDDFNENELRTIFIDMVKSKFKWHIENFNPVDYPTSSVDVASVAARRLSRSASRKGFANARSVRVMVENAMRIASKRQKKETLDAAARGEKLPDHHSITLTLPDVISPPLDPSSSEVVQSLMKMSGLDMVKQSVLGILEIAKENYKSELRGEGVLDICLHRMFLGNPGTGKTTVAGIYGRILCELGYLSIGEVTVIGASKMTGSVVGATAQQVNSLLDSVKGKVLVIDEAYVLSTTTYGREALDVLVERVQGTPGEDFAVILCGYKDQMSAMIRDGNPGLARRFRYEDAFHFDDYDDDQLVSIMMEKALKTGLYLTQELAQKAVVKVLAKQRAKPNFGNAGAVNNLLDHGKERMMNRPDREKKDGRWVLVDRDLFEVTSEGSAVAVLDHLCNMDNIRNYITKIEKRIKVARYNGKEPKNILKNFCFVGPPGTGKTTVARAFGEVFHNLGLLSSSDVVEVKAMDLIGSYVGQTAPLVNAKMDEARGGVLFIDEAYGLDSSRSAFSRDAVEKLLANMTDPKYAGNMIVILAGYAADIDKLLRSNEGLRRRITEKIPFEAWTPHDCLNLLSKLCNREGNRLPEAYHSVLLDGFADLSHRDGWGNAGDVVTLHDKMMSAREGRCDENGVVEGTYTEEDITTALLDMRSQRPLMDSTPHKGDCETIRFNAPDAICEAVQCDSGVPSIQTMENISFGELPTEDCKENIEDMEAVEEINCSDDDVLYALDSALAEMGYSIYVTRDILRSQNIPEELTAMVARKVSSSPDRVSLMLRRQCCILLPNVTELIRCIEEEEERRRLIEEAIEKAEKAKKERLREEERQRLEASKMERVKLIGRCPANFEWKKVSGGYQCLGGTHFVSDSQLNYTN